MRSSVFYVAGSLIYAEARPGIFITANTLSHHPTWARCPTSCIPISNTVKWILWILSFVSARARTVYAAITGCGLMCHQMVRSQSFLNVSLSVGSSGG